MINVFFSWIGTKSEYYFNRQLKEANLKFTSIKKDQQNQKKANQQLLEEAKKREGELTTDTHQLQVSRYKWRCEVWEWIGLVSITGPWFGISN